MSPSPSSLADLSSPGSIELQKQRRYPRGIINPNYPGFQHLAHTLAEHFIDHHQFEQSSDSEISEDFDFDVAYRGGNLGNVNIMNDSNNNNDNINNGYGSEKNIDLNRNKNRRSSFSLPESVVNDLGMNKEYEDGNVNLMLKSEPKVFCESKQLDLNETLMELERFSSDDDDEEFCNLSSSKTAPNNYTSPTDPNQMDFDDDDLADLSGEDDAAIRNELENIDTADNDFNENINCDLATYLQQYDFKMDLRKTYKYDSEQQECLTDDDNSKLPTPDILIEHNNKKLQNCETSVKEKLPTKEESDYGGGKIQSFVDVSVSDELRDYQPDLIKNITDAISTNDNNQVDVQVTEIQVDRMLHSGEGDNEISSPVEHEIPSDEKKTNDNDEKIINQVQTEMVGDEVETHLDLGPAQTVTNLPLSFESASSTNVDIIGDFGKEIEKEIGLIVSGYRNAMHEMCSTEGSSGKKAQHLIRPQRTQHFSTKTPELVFDENKFIEHLKYFSKVSECHPLFNFMLNFSLCLPLLSLHFFLSIRTFWFQKLFLYYVTQP